MKSYKLSVSCVVFAIYLAAISLLAISIGLDMLMHDRYSTVFSLLFIIVGLSYAGTALTIIFQNFKGSGLSITDKGIEDTFIIVNIFAFMFAAHIKCIPWESIKEFKKAAMIIYVDTNMVEAGFLAKLMLKLTGFNFCDKFIKPSVEVNDLLIYEDKMINK